VGNCGSGLAACCISPQAPLHRIITLAAPPTLIASLRVPGLEKGSRVVVAPVVAAINGDIIRRQARHKAALRLVVQNRDELGAIIGLAAQRLVRDDDRGSRHCGRRDTIEPILRDGDAVERVLGVVPVVDRDHTPAQVRVVARHRREHMRADRLVGISDCDRNLDGRIEHLAAPVRRRLMRVAPHVELLRRAADVDRDRLERETRLARRLGGVDLPRLGRLGRFLCGGGGVELRFRVGPGGVELASQVLAWAAAFGLRSSARALAWSVFAASSTLSANASSASARFFSDSSLRSDAVSNAVSRAIVTAPFFASSALLAASAASRASVSARAGAAAMASAFGTNSVGWENATGSALSGEMITRIPICVLSNSFSATP
jgi:hypothetical protein